ncbi:MAG: DUF6765 family protein [Pseudomonadota bacterium]
MQMDMHFNGIYALARAAGIRPETALVIAGASQFVDDAIEDKTLVFGKKAVITSMTSHKPIDYQNALSRDQWNVWSAFHFLPGFDPGADSFEAAMSCGKDSETAERIIRFALANKAQPFGPHLAGIVAHVYADTFSHYGFAGLSSDWNKVDAHSIKIHVASSSIFDYVKGKLDGFFLGLTGTAAEIIPVGHGAVATLPDRPYLRWEYTSNKAGHVERDNVEDYLKACRGLHAFFRAFLEANPLHGSPSDGSSWADMEKNVKNILVVEGKMADRINAWAQAVSSESLFRTTAADTPIAYGEDTIKEWGAIGICRQYRNNMPVETCNGYLFNKAAWKYRNYVLDDLLPSLGLMA